MKIRHLKYRIAKSIAGLFLAAGICLGGSVAYAQMDHVVGDASFDDSPVDAGLGYSYFNGPPDTAWATRGGGSWWYNAAYDSGRRPTPRTGEQAIHGGGTYAWQELGDPFVAGRTYTLSAYVAGDSDAVDASDSTWLYLYDGTATPADFNFDAGSLSAYQYGQDGSIIPTLDTGVATNTGWPRDGGTDWGLVTMSYTATASDDGKPIGIGFYGRADAAFDDISVTSVVPEPSSILLVGLGILGVMSLRRGETD